MTTGMDGRKILILAQQMEMSGFIGATLGSHAGTRKGCPCKTVGAQCHVEIRHTKGATSAVY